MSKYYEVDITKPPIGPPCRRMKEIFFFGGLYETKESKARTKDWHVYMEEYRKEFEENK